MNGSRLNERCRLFSFVFALVAATLGSIVIIAWIFEIDVLKGVVPGFPTMKLNTAISFLLLGVALAQAHRLERGPGPGSALVLACAGLVVALSAATLVEYLAGVDLGIDQLLIADPQPGGQINPPGRMAPMTSVTVLLTGTGLLLFRLVPGRYRLWQSLALASLWFGTLAGLAYLYDASSLARIYVYGSMALHSTVAVISMSLSLLLLRPAVGFVSTFTSEAAGGYAARRLLPLSLLVLVSLGLLVRQGHLRAFYDPGFAIVFVVFMGATVISRIIWWAAARLNQLDSARLEMLDSLRVGKESARALAGQLNIIIDHAPGSFAMLDRQMRYIWVSRRWKEDFRLQGRTFIGRSHYELFPEIPERWKEIHRRCLAGAIESSEEDRLERADGTVDWIRWEIRPWHDPRGEIGGIVIFTEDVTARRQAAEAARVREEQRLRQEWTSVIAHDLRQPVTAIALNAQLLKTVRGPGAPEVELKTIESIRASAELLNLVIGDLLDLSRIEARHLALEKKPLELGPLVSGIVERLKPQAQGFAVRIEKRGPDVPSLVDPLRIEQVLGNLISNAVKYGATGTEIVVEIENTESETVVSVTNTGRGITPEEVPHLFERFSRSTASRKSGVAGIGLGLYICKGIVEAHGGRIWVESVPGATTTFRFSIPRKLTVSGRAA